MMNALKIIAVLIAIYIPVQKLSALPMDARAYNILKMAQEVSLRADASGLSQEELGLVVRSSEVDSFHVQMAAAFALSLASPADGEKELSALEKSNFLNVVRMAKISKLRKLAKPLDGEERLAIFSYALGRTEYTWDRVVLVMFLGDEYKEKIVPLLMNSIVDERDSLVRVEMLFQLANYANADQLSKIRLILGREGGVGGYDEFSLQFLNLISRNVTHRSNVPGFISALIEARISALGMESK